MSLCMCPFQICDHTTQYADLAKLSHEVLEFDDIPCMPAEELETIMTGLGMTKDGLHFADTHDNHLRLSAAV